MHKEISHNILENQRKNFFNEKEANLEKKHHLYMTLPKWMQLPIPN